MVLAVAELNYTLTDSYFGSIYLHDFHFYFSQLLISPKLFCAEKQKGGRQTEGSRHSP